MTKKQFLKKCEIAKRSVCALLEDGDHLYCYEKGYGVEYSVRSHWKDQTIMVSYSPEKIYNTLYE